MAVRFYTAIPTKYTSLTCLVLVDMLKVGEAKTHCLTCHDHDIYPLILWFTDSQYAKDWKSRRSFSRQTGLI